MDATTSAQIVGEIISTVSPDVKSFLRDLVLLFKNSENLYWYQQGWVIALISSLSTGFLIFLLEFFKNIYTRRIKRKEIAFDIYNEISSVIFKIKKHREENFSTIQTFVRNAKADDSTSGRPSLLGVKRGRFDLYQAHITNLNLLANKKDGFLVVRIKMFYDALIDYDFNSELLPGMFEKYYSGDPMVGHLDIKKRGEAQYSDSKLIILIGYDIIARLNAKYRIDKSNLLWKEKRKNNRKILNTCNNETILDIEGYANKNGLELMSLLMFYHKYKIYKNSLSTGQYTRTEDGVLKKIRLFLIS